MNRRRGTQEKHPRQLMQKQRKAERLSVERAPDGA